MKRLFSAEKAGHTGTLDPMATGVLPVMLGQAAKASAFLTDSKKHYLATMRLGIETDTEDISGNVIKSSERIPTEKEVMECIKTFVGDIMQVPPMYSAIKINGKKLVDMARKGEVIEREARKITLYSIQAEKKGEREYSLDIKCSKGTYIRTVCADIGRELGCYATMTSLVRIESGGFDISLAHTVEEISEMTDEEREKLIIPVERIFLAYRKITLDPFFARLAHNGQEIYLKKIKEDLPTGEKVRLCDASGFFALGEVMLFENGSAIKPIRQFKEV